MPLLSFVILLIPAVFCASTGEIQALQDVYAACNGQAWYNNTNWLVGDPCTHQWFGISCSSGHVGKLLLTANGLSCSQLPDSIGNLFELIAMDFSDNEVQGTIPAGIQNLRTLQSLDWSHNDISGTLTPELGSLFDFSLASLDLSYNDLTGSIPTYFDGASLSSVDLSGNLFVCPIPSWATYTQATCVNWTISFLESKCVFNDQKYVVFGKNFASQAGMECVLQNRTDGSEVSRSYAEVVSDTELLCPVKYMPNNCSENNGERLFEYFKLNLAMGEAIILTQPPDVGIVNVLCYILSPQPSTVPKSEQAALEICNESNTSTPFSLPTQITLGVNEFFPVMTLSTNCSSSMTNDEAGSSTAKCYAFPFRSTVSSFCAGTYGSDYYSVKGWGSSYNHYYECSYYQGIPQSCSTGGCTSAASCNGTTSYYQQNPVSCSTNYKYGTTYYATREACIAATACAS